MCGSQRAGERIQECMRLRSVACVHMCGKVCVSVSKAKAKEVCVQNYGSRCACVSVFLLCFCIGCCDHAAKKLLRSLPGITRVEREEGRACVCVCVYVCVCVGQRRREARGRKKEG